MKSFFGLAVTLVAATAPAHLEWSDPEATAPCQMAGGAPYISVCSRSFGEGDLRLTIHGSRSCECVEDADGVRCLIEGSAQVEAHHLATSRYLTVPGSSATVVRFTKSGELGCRYSRASVKQDFSEIDWASLAVTRLAAVTGPPVILVRPPPPPAPNPIAHRILQPRWAATPSADAFARNYPERAFRLEMSGTARLDCIVAGNLRLETCRVVSEYPKDLGLAQAAMVMSRYYRLEATTADGSATEIGAHISLPITFRLDVFNRPESEPVGRK